MNPTVEKEKKPDIKFYGDERSQKPKKAKREDKKMKNKKKQNGVEVIIDHKHELTYDQDTAPKYYQVGITPQAPLKPIQK